MERITRKISFISLHRGQTRICKYNDFRLTIFQDGVTIQGTTDFNGNTTFDGVLTTITTASFGVVSSSIIPNADNAFDLGSAAYQWNEGHITTASIAHLQSKAGTVIYVSGNLTLFFTSYLYS